VPVFTFKCSKCSTEFEEEMDRNEKKAPACPDCGSKITRKVIKPHPVIFKGDGFTLSSKE